MENFSPNLAVDSANGKLFLNELIAEGSGEGVEFKAYQSIPPAAIIIEVNGDKYSLSMGELITEFVGAVLDEVEAKT